MAKDAKSPADPVIVKKYANRRLYNTDTSAYVTLDDLAEMVRSEREFFVYDAKSGEDLTHSVLTQIIVEQESRGQNLLPIPFLRQLIRFYGNSIEQLVPSYLEHSLDSLTRQQDRFHKQFSNSLGDATLDAIQEQTRQNLAVFEKAVGMFNPFASSDVPSKSSGAGNADAAVRKRQDEGADGGGKEIDDDDIAALKKQLSNMQKKLDKLSRR